MRKSLRLKGFGGEVHHEVSVIKVAPEIKTISIFGIKLQEK